MEQPTFLKVGVERHGSLPILTEIDQVYKFFKWCDMTYEHVLLTFLYCFFYSSNLYIYYAFTRKANSSPLSYVS